MADMQHQQQVRQAISSADDLSRKAHGGHEQTLSQILDGLRTTLMQVDEALGGGRSAVPFIGDLERVTDQLSRVIGNVAPELRAAAQDLLDGLQHFRAWLVAELRGLGDSLELPSRPLLGFLPLRRVIPQDVHSVLDYVHGAGMLATALAADSVPAKIAGAVHGVSSLGVSVMTDYRLSAVKVIPIEAHEAIDHLWGLSCIAAPFVLGYYKKEPVVTAVQVMLGAGTILASLFTDYRAARGVGHSLSSAR